MQNASNELRGVNILDPKLLLECAQDTSEHGRTRLAKAVSHFFEDQELNEHEQRLASEILMNLIRQAELDLRQALSERLAVQDRVPHELVVFLANDELSVAKPVLMHSPLLNDVDLMHVISNRGVEHSVAIAQRGQISPMVADRLIDKGDPKVVMSLIDNQRIHLQKGSIKKLVKVALVSEELQAPLLRRPEIDAEVAVDLYMVVSQALRNEISTRFTLPPSMVDQALDTLVHELSNEAHGARATSRHMMTLAHRFRERSDITPDLMIKTLRRGQVAFFLALFATRLQMQPEQVMGMIQKDGGKAFVVACRHIRMLKSEFASIFLLSRGIRTGDKIVDQRELAMALKHYDSLKDFDVERIIQAWTRGNAVPA